MNQALWLVLGLSGPAVLVAIVLAFLLIRRKAQDRAGVERLLAVVKNSEPAYRDSLHKQLMQHANWPEEQAQLEAEKLLKQRRQYFRQVLNGLLKRDPDALLTIETALQPFVAAHLQLLAHGAVLVTTPVALPSNAAGESAAVVAAPSASESALRGENDRLRREVGLTLSALNNIFAEYASMFGDEHLRRDMSLEEILSSMQQLAAGQPPEPAAVSEATVTNQPLSAAENLDGIDDDPTQVPPESTDDPFADSQNS